MNEPQATITDPYLVKRGDSLAKIAARSHQTIAELQRLNKIANPHQLAVGQTLYLTEQSAFGVSVNFLDALRHPIENLEYWIKHDQGELKGKTDKSGQAPRTTTVNAESIVEVRVKNLLGQWELLIQTGSDYGHKVLTLISPYLFIRGQTEAHPPGARTSALSASGQKSGPGSQAALPAQPKGTPSKNNPAVKTAKKKGKAGQSVISIGVELPPLLMGYFAQYRDQAITEVAWTDTATDLECEVEVIKAIAEVESGKAAFRHVNQETGASVPVILYERHLFKRFTKDKYTKDYPDLSGPPLSVKKDAANEDQYGNTSRSYLRLINACRLDDDAAMRACSWGKFQILGDNWKLCGATSLDQFMQSVCRSEADQLRLFGAFVRRNNGGKLWKAVKAKDWEEIAENYNGKSYKKFNYDERIKAAYIRLKGVKNA